MKAEITVVTIYRFDIDPLDYEPEVKSWRSALDRDIVIVEGRLLGDTSAPWPSEVE